MYIPNCIQQIFRFVDVLHTSRSNELTFKHKHARTHNLLQNVRYIFHAAGQCLVLFFHKHGNDRSLTCTFYLSPGHLSCTLFFGYQPLHAARNFIVKNTEWVTFQLFISTSIFHYNFARQGLISMPDNGHLPGTFTECPIHFSCCRTMSGTPPS